ncbi:MAG: RidA family protein [Candidatus Rokubacteria bacterium]|nr:RidA family protein [Candidatus Rokubacteria bacterium]
MPKPITPKGLGAPMGMYSHGMVGPGGELIVVAGQVGSAAGQAPAADVGTQTQVALENVRAIVEAGGASMRDVIRLQTFLTRAEDIPAFMKARGEAYPKLFPDGVYPPNTLLIVSRLVRPELLVEIEAMAVRTPKRAAAAASKAPARSRGRRPAKARRR